MDEFLMQLQNGGIDQKGAMERFANNIVLYKKYLFKFHTDLNMSNTIDAFAQKDYQQAYFNVHTLKGTSGNLGLVKVFEVTSTISMLLKEGKNQEAEDVLPSLKSAYDDICAFIATLSGE